MTRDQFEKLMAEAEARRAKDEQFVQGLKTANEEFEKVVKERQASFETNAPRWLKLYEETAKTMDGLINEILNTLKSSGDPKK